MTLGYRDYQKILRVASVFDVDYGWTAVIVQAFIDDSGSVGDGNFICLAGYLSDEPRWLSFGLDWQDLLKKHEVEYIHIKSLLPGRDIYEKKQWTQEHRNQIAREFIHLIMKYDIAGFAVAVDAVAWRALQKEKRRCLGDPFLICFPRMIRLMAHHVQTLEPPTGVHLIIDDSEHYATKFLSCFHELRRSSAEVRARFPILSIADDSYFSQLQAADVFSYAAHRELKYGEKGWHDRDLFAELVTSSPSHPYSGEFFDTKKLEALPASKGHK